MKVAALQYDVAWMDRDANWRTIDRLLGSANLSPGTLVLTPELADTGFTMDDPPSAGPEPVAAAAERARRHGVWMQLGHAERTAVGKRNAATVVAPDGSTRCTYRKVHLFSPGREDRHYLPGDEVAVVDVEADDGTWRVAPAICYDLRFPELFRLAALAGAEVFTIGACWPAPRAAHRRALAIARAIENQAYVVACNRIGRDPNVDHAGDSFVVAPSGEVIAEGGDAECVLVASLDRDALLRWRDKFPALRDLRRSMIGNVRIH